MSEAQRDVILTNETNAAEMSKGRNLQFNSPAE